MRFSILTLLALTALVAVVTAYATWQRKPAVGQWLYVDQHDSLFIYQVKEAQYNTYFDAEDGNSYFLTMTCDTSGIVWPENANNYTPSLEFSIAFDSDPTTQIKSGAKLPITVYSPTLYNMTGIAWVGSAGPFEEAHVIINRVQDTYIDATLIGVDEYDAADVSIRALFMRTPTLKRRFN